MPFLEKYPVKPLLLTPGSRRRPGLPLEAVRFAVLHDTGNPGSTARGNVRYYERSRDEVSASAHLFVDDREILECVPALTAPPEKAWHVRESLPKDDALFGADANAAAIGIEYCYGGDIDADEAYRRYVWVAAFVCHRFGLDPEKALVGHFVLDPGRKTDPVTGLAKSRRTYPRLLADIAAEYRVCAGLVPPLRWVLRGAPGAARATARLNVRRGEPSTRAPVARTVPAGAVLPHVGWVTDGQSIGGNPRWFQDREGNWFWSGGTAG